MENQEKVQTNEETVQTSHAMTLFNDDEPQFIADLTQRTMAFCSMKATDPASKAALFKAMNNPEKRLGDCINMTIRAKDVYCEVVKVTNKETGDISQAPRIVVIDDKGTGYQAVSMGIFSALKKIIQVYGEPTWDTPLTLKVVQVTRGDRKLLTFDVVA